MPRCPSRYQGRGGREGGAMAVKTVGRRSASPAARAFRRDSERAGTPGQLSHADRVALGKDARRATPREAHAEFQPGGSRDPVGLLLEQSKSRVPELVPIRHGRMLVSAFTFYRGAALPMAADLATTPTSGLQVQLCGDAHLSNFGAFASPERELVFDVNDFDETLPGPVRMGRQAAGGEPGGGGTRERVPSQAPPQDRPRGGAGVPEGDARVREADVPAGVVRASGHRRGHRSSSGPV